MLVITLNSGDMVDIAGMAKIKVFFDPQGRNRIRLSIDSDAAPITRIKKDDLPTKSCPLDVNEIPVYKQR